MRPGDRCRRCNKGYMERIIVPASTGGSMFNLITLGLAGDDEREYFKCTHCKMEVEE